MRKILLLLLLAVAVATTAAVYFDLGGPKRKDQAQARQAGPLDADKLAPYRSRFGRARPVVAVIGENAGTEITDYAVPYAVLARSGAAEVVALATRPGPIEMIPALKIEPQETIAAFDARFPEGADYVIVPAVHDQENAALLGWIAAQAGKGATIVGVCDGVWVVAGAGLLKGRQATGHWFSLSDLGKKFPQAQWVREKRYIADGPVVTTTGVTASIPVSLALVEAIAGRERAEAVAREIGVTDWTASHEGDAFRLGARHIFTAVRNMLAFWSHENVGIPVAAGTDEIALALTAAAYSRTYRSQAFSVAPSDTPIRLKSGLMLLPDRTNGTDRSLADLETGAAALDKALAGIEAAYGRATAAFVALQVEYPGY